MRHTRDTAPLKSPIHPDMPTVFVRTTMKGKMKKCVIRFCSTCQANQLEN